MSGRFRNKTEPSRPALSAASAQRYVAAWLAILALYLQIAAAGLCTCGLPVLTDASAGPGAFPICHSQSNDEAQTQSDHAPAHHHQQDCPFCTAHCHAAMVVTPSISGLDSIYAVATTSARAPFIVPQAARFPAGAPPRGPPASA
ncbi:MAG: DUF2946 family protein [Methylovirgula sp.]